MLKFRGLCSRDEVEEESGEAPVPGAEVPEDIDHEQHRYAQRNDRKRQLVFANRAHNQPKNLTPNYL